MAPSRGFHATASYTCSWNAENELTKVEKNGSEVARFAYDIHGLRIDEPLAKEDIGVPSEFHADALGSIAAVTNTAGSVGLTRGYDAWGVSQIGASEPGYAFAGREWDPEVVLCYYRARHYPDGLDLDSVDDCEGHGEWHPDCPTCG